ncbi:TPA: hypothetical protein ACN98P_003588, partial [Vibrio parahaemolyticus]
FVNQLTNHTSIVNAIINFLFARNENLYLYPVWWDSLDENKKISLLEIFACTDLSMPSYMDDILTDLVDVSENKLVSSKYVNF